MPSGSENDRRRSLPSIGRLLESPAAVAALALLPRPLLVDALRDVLEQARRTGAASEDEMLQVAIARAETHARPSLRRAINATGVVLHTGLGRAVLSEAAQRAVTEVAAGHSVLEIDAESGRRGSRQSHVRALFRELTDAESALVVNNNAGAVFLAVTALALGSEVILSRGELVEIGGAFRMPDIVRASGATLVEVGTTNRTRLRDFDEAITERTGLLLRCHPSNFKIVGFTEEVPAAELAALGRRHGIPVMDDLGSGAIVDVAAVGAAPTATLRQAIESGCDVVTASGDKLLGGPQAGIILGRAEYVERIAKHPLARALRVDKMTLAALEATLRLYRDPARAWREIPTLRYIGRAADDLRDLAEELRNGLCALPGVEAEVAPERSQVGGGSLPGEELPTTCVRLRLSGLSAEHLAAALRRWNPPIFARVKEGDVLLDPRTLEPAELTQITEAVRSLTPIA